MKTALLCLAFLALPSFAGETVALDEPEEKTPAEELRDIADVMLAMEDRLADDLHNEIVHLQGKEIEDRIEKLIKKAEEEEREEREGKKNGKRPAKRAQGGHFAENIDQRESAIARESEWARIPAAERDAVIQVWASEAPLRWKLRIAAYFLSVNAELDPSSVELPPGKSHKQRGKK